ncbi:MAG TPA: LacI family DNA-binding transcriptional regulator [Aggregatilineales bacterium]|nr:LacI family DNA-binding transcriptional regulator [Aggregatilineales bacterium]
MPTIKDVAKTAGVSIATVSYVLNNRNDMVGEQTRQHVLEVARQLGYTPNIIARNLQASRTSLLGYAWHINPGDQPNLVMDQFIYHLAHAAEGQHYHLLTFTHPNEGPIGVYEELIQTGRVDGFVLSGTQYDDPRIKYLMRQKFPFVSFGRSNPDWAFNWVDTDGQAGMRLATEYLLDIGHRRIAFLGWPKESLTGNYRLAGYTEALTNVGIVVRDDYVIHNDYARNSIENAFGMWLDLDADQRPTAIVAISDYVAVAAMRASEQFGFRVGETMSIVGFDDAPFVRFLQPGLTTLRQPLAEITQRLVKHVSAMIRGEDEQPLNYLVTPELIIRGSTGPHQGA